MHILFSYSYRNNLRHPGRTLMTITGIALTVFAALLMLALSRGLYIRTRNTGSEKNIIALSSKGKSVMFSNIKEVELVDLMTLPGLAKQDDEYLISPEIMHVVYVEAGDGDHKRRAPINIRGINGIAFDIHRKVRITEGRLPEEDFEVLVGKTAYIRLGVPKSALEVGKTVRFENKTWTVCGHFDANSSMLESEFWVQEGNLQQILHRPNSHTFVVMKFANKDIAKEALANFSTTSAVQKNFKGWVEKQYYRDFSKPFEWIVYLSSLMVIIIASAGLLVGINTMYTSIMQRISEFSTLRVLGFTKLDIYVAVVTESLFIAAVGGAIGIALGLMLNDIPFKLANSAFYLVVDHFVIIMGAFLAFLIGLIGATIPAIRALRIRVIDSLRR